MKKLIVCFFLLNIFYTKNKSHIVQAHKLKKNLKTILLYGDIHNLENKNIEQNIYLNDKILPNTDSKIISEQTFVAEDMSFINGIFATTYSEYCPLIFLKIKNLSPFCNKIITIDNRIFIKKVFRIKNILNKSSEKLEKKTVQLIQKIFNNIFLEINMILQNLETEYEQRLNKFDLTVEEQILLIKILKKSQKKIAASVEKWRESLKKETNKEIFKKINDEIIPKTTDILDLKLVLKVFERIKVDKKAIIFAGRNHINNLIKIFNSIEFYEEEEEIADVKTGLDAEFFDWILN